MHAQKLKTGCGWILLLGVMGWSALAVSLSDLGPLARAVGCGGIVLGVGLRVVMRSWRYRFLPMLCVFGVVLSWWLSLSPSNTRDWQADVAVLPWAEITGDIVTMHNIRHCEYRSETDYTPRYASRTFSLRDLRGVDLFLVYWGSPYIAHTMLSFDFGDGHPVCFSIETRKSKGESYSALRGFFRQYELIYVVGDERDLVRLRTNFRKEDVYLYRLAFNYDIARSVFLEYVRRVNQLHANPEWYNALITNCTTDIRRLARPYTTDARMDWRLLVNGLADAMAYERGMLNTSIPFAELKKHSHINARAQAVTNSEAFSRHIREGLPEALSSRKNTGNVSTRHGSKLPSPVN